MEVGPTKDVILALLDFLVDPLLPSTAKSSSMDKVISQQALVAKQVHAVVLLYNYYHRKLHPNLEFLEFESFCKMAVALKPSLLPYLNLMQEVECTKKDDLDVNLSLTEKAINNCCRICKLLDASVNYPPIEGWPISRVSVFLVDSKIENCYLFHSSITQGVWSMIEKDVDESTRTSEAVPKMKSGNKKKKAPKGSPNKNQAANEASLLQIAWSAVKESCGISQDDLRVLEDSTVYSISKEKTAVRFYIMQCTETNGDGNLVPINDVIKSMQGPLVVKESDCWLTTSAIECFHLLPFADKVLDWLSRVGYQVEKDDTNGNSFHAAEPPLNTSLCPQRVKEIENDEKEQQNNSHQYETIKEADKGLECLEAFKGVKNCSSTHLEMKLPLNTSNRFETTIENLTVENSTDSHINVEALPTCSEAAKVVENDDFSKFSDKQLIDTPQPTSFEAAKVVENDDFSKFSDEQLMDAPQPFEVVSKTRNDDCYYSEKEHLHFSQHESEKEVKYISHSCGNEEGANVLVYKRNRYRKKCNTEISGVEISNSTMESPKQQDEIHSVTDSSTNMDIDESIITCSLADGRSDMFPCKDNVDNQKLVILAEEKDQTTPTEAAEVIDNLPNSDEHSVQQLTLASKEASLSKNFRRRDMLSELYRSVADDLVLCESCIHTILSAGNEENISVKADAGIEGCTDITTSEDIDHHFLDRELRPGVKRKRLSEANLFVHSPCQELDDICNENGWRLPTYNVSPSEGGFQASVTMKGIDFDCSCEGDISDNPREARNSAAVKMMVKVRRMAEGS